MQAVNIRDILKDNGVQVKPKFTADSPDAVVKSKELTS